jgi:hypothetical protein
VAHEWERSLIASHSISWCQGKPSIARDCRTPVSSRPDSIVLPSVCLSVCLSVGTSNWAACGYRSRCCRLFQTQHQNKNTMSPHDMIIASRTHQHILCRPGVMLLSTHRQKLCRPEDVSSAVLRQCCNKLSASLAHRNILCRPEDLSTACLVFLLPCAFLIHHLLTIPQPALPQKQP